MKATVGIIVLNKGFCWALWVRVILQLLNSKFLQGFGLYYDDEAKFGGVCLDTTLTQ